MRLKSVPPPDLSVTSLPEPPPDGLPHGFGAGGIAAGDGPQMLGGLGV
jgi:hypothetical protein